MANSEFNQIKYQNDYNKQNYDDVRIAVKKGLKPKWQEAAKKKGVSLARFITTAVDAYMQDSAN